jgi:hypothetical protein
VGAVDAVRPTADIIDRWAREYGDAKARLNSGSPMLRAVA